MEHPGLSVKTIRATLSLEEIQQKISDLNSRLSFAYRINNQELINQLTMVLETYNRAYTETIDATFGNNPSVDGEIDIS